MVLVEIIYSANTVPNEGGIWFKGMDLDIEHNNYFFKPQYKDSPSHIFHSRKLLDKYTPLMWTIMKYFTCEGRFNRFYQYHINFLMHFTSQGSLKLPYYLFKILGKMIEKVHSKGKYHSTSLFNHALIKQIVLH